MKRMTGVLHLTMRRVHWHFASDRALVAVSCTYRQRTTCRSGCAAENVARTVANTAARAIASSPSSTFAGWRRRCVTAIHTPSSGSSTTISSTRRSIDHSDKVKLVHDDYWVEHVASGTLAHDDAQQRVARQLQRLQIVLSSQYSSNQPVLQSYTDYLYRRHLYDQKVANNTKSKTLRQTKSTVSTASTVTTLRLNDDSNQTIEHQDALELPPLLPPINAIPRGLYLYGTVGTGKSMLMDAFYQYTRYCRKKRYHFYEFMNDIHQRLHRLRIKQRSDLRPLTARRIELCAVDGNNDIEDSRTSFVSTLNPVVQVALQMASECTLLCLDEFQVVDIADAVILSQLLSTLLACGTVLVTTSNRSPYALYDDPSLGGRQSQNNDNDTHLSPFIKVLKAHCIVHEIKTTIDYRHVVASAATAITKSSMPLQPQPKELPHGIGTTGNSDTTSTNTSTNTSKSGMFLVASPAKAASSIVTDNPRHQSTDQSQSQSTIDLLQMVNDALETAATIGLSSLSSHASIKAIELDAGFGRIISVQAMTVPTMRESSSRLIKVAYCTFDELCSSRRSHCHYGPSDYRALARHFDAIILRDIPVLSNGNMADVMDSSYSSYSSSSSISMRDHNEARRFIALIDELYEAQTLVACSAAVPLSDLFQVVQSPHDDVAAEAGSSSLLIDSVKELPFAFRRAASRLVELTSFQKWNQLCT